MCDFSITLVLFLFIRPTGFAKALHGLFYKQLVINLWSQSSQTTMDELNCKILKLKSHYGTHDYDNKNPEGF